MLLNYGHYFAAFFPVGVVASTDKLELARRLASKINMAKNLGAEAKGATQQAAEAILKGGGSHPIITVSLLIYCFDKTCRK